MGAPHAWPGPGYDNLKQDQQTSNAVDPTKGLLTRRGLLQLAAGAGVVTMTGGLLDAMVIEPRWLQLNRVEIPVPNLPRAWDGFRIAQLSDIHLGRFTGIGLLQEAVALANSEKPDFVALTGDYVSRTNAVTPELSQTLSMLRAPLGVAACLGNHDYWTDIEQVKQSLRQAGIRVLVNARFMMYRNGAPLCIAGIDDPLTGQPDIAPALAGVPDDVCRIVLCHNPDFVLEVPENIPVNLMLCGHTHGGQANLPILGPIKMGIQARKYARGLVLDPPFPVFTSVGIGTVLMPIRFRCRPEVAILTLRRA